MNHTREQQIEVEFLAQQSSRRTIEKQRQLRLVAEQQQLELDRLASACRKRKRQRSTPLRVRNIHKTTGTTCEDSCKRNRKALVRSQNHSTILAGKRLHVAVVTNNDRTSSGTHNSEFGTTQGSTARTQPPLLNRSPTDQRLAGRYTSSVHHLSTEFRQLSDVQLQSLTSLLTVISVDRLYTIASVLQKEQFNRPTTRHRDSLGLALQVIETRAENRTTGSITETFATN